MSDQVQALLQAFPGLPRETAEVAADALELHAKKMRDYGSAGDPYANVSSSAEWGVDPWVGASIRMADKERRLRRYAETGTLANEGAEDSLLDNCVYPLIRLALWRRQYRKAAELEVGALAPP